MLFLYICLLAVSIRIILGVEAVCIQILLMLGGLNLVEGIRMKDFARLDFEVYLLDEMIIKKKYIYIYAY